MLVLGVGVFELVDGVRQRLGDEAAAVLAEVTFGIGLLVIEHGVYIPARCRSAARTAATNWRIFSGSLMPLRGLP